METKIIPFLSFVQFISYKAAFDSPKELFSLFKKYSMTLKPLALSYRRLQLFLKQIMNEEEKLLLLALSGSAASPPAIGNQLTICSGRDLN